MRSFVSLWNQITSSAMVSRYSNRNLRAALTGTERIHLCLHLLRLRPTPAQLKQWNKDCVEPHKTHVTKGWTNFLKELAPPEIVFDEKREPDDKTEERQKLLAQAYDLAYREEQYVNSEIGL
jgi:hypothetical protein